MSSLIRREAQGEIEKRHYHRAVVLAVDLDGGLLQNELGTGAVDVVDRFGKNQSFKAIVGPKNPRGSVKARVISDGLDRLLSDDDVRVFWPMMPSDQISMPVSPGEHVYVVFDGVGTDHGLWISRVSGHDSANSYAGVDSYTAPSSQETAMDSFEPNEPEYPRDDNHAALAPPIDSTSFFPEG